MTESRDADLTVERLRHALTEGEIEPWYQPIVELSTGTLLGFEALARWTRDGAVVHSPLTFVAFAEAHELAMDIDLAIVAPACRAFAQWQEQFPQLRLAMNFSGRHIDEGGWDLQLHAYVRNSGLDPATVDIELTETVRPKWTGRTAGAITRLRTWGYAVWFDDFGTGWSELRDLVDLDVSGIKIDRYFATANTPRADAVLRTLLQLAGDLDLSTVVEGIETDEQAERAVSLGATAAQGFRWSPAVPGDEVSALLAGETTRPGLVIPPAR